MKDGRAASGHLDDTLPKEVQFVLAWNPPKLHTDGDSEAGIKLPTRAPPDTAPSSSCTTPIRYSCQAAFYDRHLAPHLILERVVYFDTLFSTMANTVDQAIQDAVAKRPLPKTLGMLRTEEQIKSEVKRIDSIMNNEMEIAQAYLSYVAAFCRPIASTLALHPSFSEDGWISLLLWTLDGKIKRWSIADGVLRISRSVFANDELKEQVFQNENTGKKGIMEQLANRATALAVWNIKSLAEGTAQVMEEILEMGLTQSKFPWKKCILSACNHRLWEDMEESRERYNAGFDPRSPPWRLPPVPAPFTSSADSRPTSMSPVGNDEGMREKRRRNDSDASGYERPPLDKSTTDLMGGSYEQPPGARQEVNAQLFLQQTWAQAVVNNCTIMVMHSGNHEIIGIRHRETQTLYISHAIEPHSCSDPAYGKIQVGVYIAAALETIDREKQDIEAREKTVREPPADVPLNSEKANPDAYLNDYSPKGPTRSKRSGGSGSKGKGNDRGKVIDDQALLANAARQNHVCLRFFYDIYDSPHPATFRRVPDKPKEAAIPVKPPTPSLLAGRETTPPSEQTEPFIHITVHSELAGSTGIVHIGTMAVDPSGPTAKVAVKLAFCWEEKSELMNEHRVYSYLHSKRVQGIPCIVGLFVDEEPLLGGEGPYALVMTYAGVSLSRRYELATDSAKNSLLATLASIHRANVLHGDIHLANLCISPSGEASVIGFNDATESRSRRKKAREMRELSYILETVSPTEPAAKDVEKAQRKSGPEMSRSRGKSTRTRPIVPSGCRKPHVLASCSQAGDVFCDRDNSHRLAASASPSCLRHLSYDLLPFRAVRPPHVQGAACMVLGAGCIGLSTLHGTKIHENHGTFPLTFDWCSGKSGPHDVHATTLGVP